MKPVIGITSNVELDNKHTLQHAYIKAIIRAGGLPIVITTGVEEDVQQLTKLLDGLLLTGGGDINPLAFGEEPHQNLGDVSSDRDSMELELVRQMLISDKPMLGICRGHQILNVALGGTLFQDISSQNDNPLLQHSQKARRDHRSHFVQIQKGSLLESISTSEKIMVNSYHHQAVKDVLVPLAISGVASDGIVEAIESSDHRFVLGVQWHPEALAESGDPVSLRLFENFMQACKERGK